jgi:hypothetical protein
MRRTVSAPNFSLQLLCEEVFIPFKVSGLTLKKCTEMHVGLKVKYPLFALLWSELQYADEC